MHCRARSDAPSLLKLAQRTRLRADPRAPFHHCFRVYTFFYNYYGCIGSVYSPPTILMLFDRKFSHQNSVIIAVHCQRVLRVFINIRLRFSDNQSFEYFPHFISLSHPTDRAHIFSVYTYDPSE